MKYARQVLYREANAYLIGLRHIGAGEKTVVVTPSTAESVSIRVKGHAWHDDQVYVGAAQ